MAGAVLLLEDDPALYSVLVEVFADDGLEVIPCVSPDEVAAVVAPAAGRRSRSGRAGPPSLMGCVGSG
jgi:hypothetical protein